MNIARITGWKPGLHTIELLRIIRSFTVWGSACAKERIEGMIAGTPLEIPCEDADTAKRFEAEATSVDCICEVRIE